jgi:hypothetical protein
MHLLFSVSSVTTLCVLVLIVIAAALALHVALDNRTSRTCAAAARIARAKIRAREFRHLMRGARANVR